MVLKPCPNAHELQRYLLGQTPATESKSLEEHLRACSACTAFLNRLLTEDPLLETVRARAGPAFTLDNKTASAVIARLKKLAAGDTSRSEENVPTVAPAGEARGGADPPPNEPGEWFAEGVPVSSFLAPPRGPGELGWLGPYRILKVLGKGGMGAVLQAEDPDLQRLAAVKIMLPGLAATPSARQRFLREARSAAAVKHDHIVTIYQVGEAFVEKAGPVPFLAMEFLRGEPLDGRLKRDRKLPVAEVLRIGSEVAKGLAAAHQAGLIHRDIKPGNIWLDADAGRVKILDFGLARSVAEESNLTQQGAIVGTPAYMAPEQTDGRPVDARADLFSLGCVLYLLATGKQPFAGKDMMSTLMAVALDQPKPPRELSPETPPALSDFVMRLLAKDPAQRPATAGEVADRLQAIEREQVAPPPVESSTAPRRWRGRVAAAVVLAALLPVVYYFSTIVRFATDQGQVVIEADDDDIEVTVKRNGAVIRDPKGKRTITLTAGKQTLDVVVQGADGEIRTFTKQFTLSRGGKKILDIRQELARLPPAVKVAPPPGEPADALKRTNILEEALAWPGGGDAGKAPPELVAILGDGRFRIFNGSCFLNYSPDGKLLAVPAGNTVFVLDARTGEFKRRLVGHTDRIICVAFSRDGSRLASGGEDRTIRLWDTNDWSEEHTLTGHSEGVKGLAFRWDSQALAAGCMDGSIRLWDPRNGALLSSAKKHASAVLGMAFRLDGKMLASGSGGPNGSVHTWDTSAGKLDPGRKTATPTPEGDEDRTRLVFSPDGKQLAFGGADAVRLFNPETLAEVRTLPANGSGLVAFRSDGKELLVSGHHYPGETSVHTLERWNVVTGKKGVTLELQSHGEWAHLALSPDGKTLALAAGGETVVRIFDAATGKPRYPDPGHTEAVIATAFSPDGKWLASAGHDYAVHLWDMSTGKLVRAMTGHTERVVGLAFSPDGKLLASSSFDGTIRLWGTATGRRAGTLTGVMGEAAKVAFSPDGKQVAAAGHDKTVRVWDLAKPDEPRVLEGFQKAVEGVAFSADGKQVAGGSEDGTARVWDSLSGKHVRTIQTRSSVMEVAFTKEGDLLTAGGGGGICRWSLKSGELKQTLWGSPFDLYNLAVRQDGLLASCGSEGVVRLWDPRKTPLRRKSWRLFPEDTWIQGLAFSPGGGYLAVGNPDGTVYVFKVPRELPEREVGQVRLLEKGPAAPDRSRAKPLYLDTFRDPTSGFHTGADGSVRWGYDKGKYSFVVPDDHYVGRIRSPDYEDFACEVQGRVVGRPEGSWGVYLEHAGTSHGIRVMVDGKGRWQVAPSFWDPELNRGPYSGLVEHRAVKRGASLNKILVVIRRRRLEIYINGEAVCEPVMLDRDVTPGKVGLIAEARGADSRMELERLTIWPARDR